MEKKRRYRGFLALILAAATLLLPFMGFGRDAYADEINPEGANQGPSTIHIKVYKEDLPYAQAPLRLMKFEGSFPTVVASLNTEQDGTCEIGDFAPNALYEIIMEDHKIKFDIDKIRFQTDVQGRVIKIRDRQIVSEQDNRIEFRGYNKNENVLATQTATFYTFDKETFAPVEGVELTANVILPKLSSYKTIKSDQNGVVNFDLEGQAEGKIYVVTISKNGRFLWENDQNDMMIIVKEDEVEYLSEPIFYVTKNNRSYLREELESLISEAEQYIENNNEFTNAEALKKLKGYIDTAREELAKETIPEYVEGFIKGIRESMEELKQYEKEKPAPDQEPKETQEEDQEEPEQDPKVQEATEAEKPAEPKEGEGDGRNRLQENIPPASGQQGRNTPSVPEQQGKEENTPGIPKQDGNGGKSESAPKTENRNRKGNASSSGRGGRGIVRKNEIKKDMRGSWIRNEKGWWYKRADASYPSDGWIKLEKTWYHFDKEGYMSVGWVHWKGDWYYLDTDGKMLYNTTTPDGYKLGADGAWIRN